jgi:ArsR family metal-binding transcriptional regulator
LIEKNILKLKKESISITFRIKDGKLQVATTDINEALNILASIKEKLKSLTDKKLS